MDPLSVAASVIALSQVRITRLLFISFNRLKILSTQAITCHWVKIPQIRPEIPRRVKTILLTLEREIGVRSNWKRGHVPLLS